MPSQLKRLRESLKNAGVIGQPQKSKKAKKRAQQNRSGNDARLSKEAALQSIREEFNPFEIKKNKEKFSVAGGRKVKGTQGKPGISKQIGEETRRKTILVEMQQRNKIGGIIDRRFGENDPTMAPEDKMLERFTREQQQRAYKSDIFNLEDDDEVLTHYGQSLGSLKADDFHEGVEDAESDDDMLRLAKRAHSLDGEFARDEDENGPPRKKTKTEVMKEVIAKSKFHKYERQQEKEADEDIREELDAQLGDIRALLAGIPAKPPPLKELNGATNGVVHADRVVQINGGLDLDLKYDTSVREMTYDRRSKPADRTKTAEELAEERATQLEKMERSRQKRMRGEESTDDEVEEQEDMSDNEFGLGKGIKLAREERDLVHGTSDTEEEGSSENEEQSSNEDNAESEDDEDEQAEAKVSPLQPLSSRRQNLDNYDAYSDDYESDEDLDAPAVEEGISDSEDSEDDDLVGLGHEPSIAKASGIANSVTNSDSALPYTFPSPQSHTDFLKVVSPHSLEDLPVIIKRIRALHHPSLHPDNKGKLSTFTSVIFDHIIYLSDLQIPSPTHVIEVLLRHLHSLSKEFPQASAAKFREYLQKLFDRIGHQKKPKRSDLMILTALGVIFPTSDHFHIVVTPAMLVMARWLSSVAPTDIQRMAQGCYIVTLCLQYQRLSKRIIPEVLNYIYQCLITLSPVPPTKPPGFFPLHTGANSMSILASPKHGLGISKLKFKDFLYPSSIVDQNMAKVGLASTFTRQILALAKLYASKSTFIELFSPAVVILTHLKDPACAKSLPDFFTSNIKDTVLPELSRLRDHAQKFRRPLELHHHRSLPIPSHAPKFEEEYSLDRHKSSYDPDRERKEMSKLKAEHKKERKGAMRELRKDSQFIAREKLKERKVADQEYHEKMKRIVGMIQNEEGAAANAYEREKAGRKKKGKR